VAAREYGRAIDVFRRLVLRNPDNVDFLGYLAGTLNNLADVQQSLRRFDEAIGSFEEGLRHQRKAVSQAPGIQHQRRTLSRLLHNLARAYRLAERPAEAVRLTLERRLLYPDDYAAQYDVARDLALALPLITDDPAEHERVARLTVETLNRAVDTGFRNKARFDEAEWKPLRNRDDFAKLMDRFTRDS
jgi:tetratricopeptide (TPR) repeat protein